MYHHLDSGMRTNRWRIVVLATHLALAAAAGGGRLGFAVLPARIGPGPAQGVPRRFDEISSMEPHSWNVGPGEPLALRMEYTGASSNIPTSDGNGTDEVNGDIHNQESGTQSNVAHRDGAGSRIALPTDRVFNPGASANAGDGASKSSYPDVQRQLNSPRADVVSGDVGEPCLLYTSPSPRD